MHEVFEAITPHWLNRAHMYNGSIGPFNNDFRYRMKMDKDAGIIHAAAYSKLCIEKADDVIEKDFTWDEAGVNELKSWLQCSYESFLNFGSVHE